MSPKVKVLPAQEDTKENEVYTCLGQTFWIDKGKVQLRIGNWWVNVNVTIDILVNIPNRHLSNKNLPS